MLDGPFHSAATRLVAGLLLAFGLALAAIPSDARAEYRWPPGYSWTNGFGNGEEPGVHSIAIADAGPGRVDVDSTELANRNPIDPGHPYTSYFTTSFEPHHIQPGQQVVSKSVFQLKSSATNQYDRDNPDTTYDAFCSAKYDNNSWDFQMEGNFEQNGSGSSINLHRITQGYTPYDVLLEDVSTFTSSGRFQHTESCSVSGGTTQGVTITQTFPAAETARMTPGCYWAPLRSTLADGAIGNISNTGSVAVLTVGNVPGGCTNKPTAADVPACSDGKHNDSDGLMDWPQDPGCSSPADTSELGQNLCDNGIDDDQDGYRDWPADGGCAGAHGAYEASAPSAFFTPRVTDKLNRIVMDPSGSSAAPGSTYVWDFGDGETWAGSNPSHRYARSRDYAVRLTITQPDGRSATALQTFRIPSAVIAESTCGTVKSGASRGRKRCYLVLSNEYAAAMKKGGKMLLQGRVVSIVKVVNKFAGETLFNATAKKGIHVGSEWYIKRYIGNAIFGDYYKLGMAYNSVKWASQAIIGGSMVALYREIGDPNAANQWCVNAQITWRGKGKAPSFGVMWPYTFVRNYKRGVSKLGMSAYHAEWDQGGKRRELPQYCTGLMGMAWHTKSLRDAEQLLDDPKVSVLRAGPWEAADARMLE